MDGWIVRWKEVRELAFTPSMSKQWKDAARVQHHDGDDAADAGPDAMLLFVSLQPESQPDIVLRRLALTGSGNSRSPAS